MKLLSLLEVVETQQNQIVVTEQPVEEQKMFVSYKPDPEETVELIEEDPENIKYEIVEEYADQPETIEVVEEIQEEIIETEEILEIEDPKEEMLESQEEIHTIQEVEIDEIQETPDEFVEPIVLDEPKTTNYFDGLQVYDVYSDINSYQIVSEGLYDSQNAGPGKKGRIKLSPEERMERRRVLRKIL